MSTPYIFRIDEISEHAGSRSHVDNRGNWMPSTDLSVNHRTSGGSSGLWWSVGSVVKYGVLGGSPPSSYAYPELLAPDVNGTKTIQEAREQELEPSLPYKPYRHDSQPVRYCTICGSPFLGTFARGNLRRHVQDQHHNERAFGGKDNVIISNSRENTTYAGAPLWMDAICISGSSISILGATNEISGQPSMSAILSRWMGPLVAYGSDVCSSTGICTGVICIISFAISTTCLYKLHKGDEHQDKWLLSGIGIGVMAGILVGASLESTVLRVVSWTILLALLGSSIMHRMLRHRGLLGTFVEDI